MEEIDDQDELKQVKGQAMRVLGKSFLASLVLTLIAMVFP